MRPGSVAWWATKARQAKRHLLARVSRGERDSLLAWLSPAQVTVFDAMHVADRRHGLDVVAALRAAGIDDPEVLIAGLLHDAGKGDSGIVSRVVYSLGTAGIGWVEPTVAWLRPIRRSLERLRAHQETSARIAEAAGCSPRTVELIRWQDDPRDPEAGEQLRLADERS